MDNLCHSLCGAALAKTPLGRMSPLAPASLIVGANLPDIDAFTRLVADKAVYLVHHRGLTHSLLGVVVQALLLAAVIRGLEELGARRARRRGREPIEPRGGRLPWRAHLVPAFAALLSHPLLDLLNNYGVRPWLPFSEARYYGDLVFIVDLVLVLLFGAIALLAGPRSRAGGATWLLVAAGTTLFLFTHERTPAHVKWCWPFALALLVVLRRLGIGRARPARVIAVGALLIAAYLGGLALSAELAWRNVQAATDPRQQLGAGEVGAGLGAGINGPWRLAMRSPVLADPLHWTFVLETPDAWHMKQVSARGDVVRSFSVGPRLLADPRVQAAAATPAGAAWRYFARLPWAWIEESPARTTVGLTDARYHFAQGPQWCSVEVELPPPALLLPPDRRSAPPGGPSK